MSLARFRVPEPVPLGILPLSFNYDEILAFDQALANTGWVYLHRPDGNLRAHATGLIKTYKVLESHADNLKRGTDIFTMVSEVIALFQPKVVVHETPPVGRAMKRPDASLIAAMAVRCAASIHDIPVVMVDARRAKKRLTGNGNAEKSEVREAVRKIIPNINECTPLNEHVYDAMALGLVAMEEQ